MGTLQKSSVIQIMRRERCTENLSLPAIVEMKSDDDENSLQFTIIIRSDVKIGLHGMHGLQSIHFVKSK